MTTAIGIIYTIAVFGLALYGALGFLTLVYYLKHRRDSVPTPALKDEEWPLVTVQLPVYNESMVVERLIAAAANLDYPPDKLQIQVLDDSIDETTDKAARIVTELKSHGVNIELLHRLNRNGYKAGALSEALVQTKSDYVAIFDADFQPEPDFLRRTIPFSCRIHTLVLFKPVGDIPMQTHLP
ncbi:MAG: glycosyltransferase [Chloroflexota bacterium]